MVNDEIYDWLDRPFHELTAAEQEAVLREMGEHEYTELHRLHLMAAAESSFHMQEAEEMAIHPLFRPEAGKIRHLPYWAAAACVALAVICTRVFWTREIQVPVVSIKYDTVRLQETVAIKVSDTVKVYVSPSRNTVNKIPNKLSAVPSGTVNNPVIGPDLGEIHTGVVKTGSVPAGQRSLAENELARGFRYVRM